MSNISTDLQDVEKIIVLDYGSQYNQLISRRIREIGVFSELKSHKISAAEVRAINPIGIVLSGGPNSVYEEGSFDIDPEIFELGIPILGICYGMQLLTHKLGGKVVPAGDAGNREYGQSTLTHTESALFAGTPDEQLVLMSHGDAVTEIPEGFHLVGDSVDCPFAAMENTEKNFYGIQFHPEVRHSVYGNDILKNFAFGICGAKGDWSMANFVDMQIAQIREQLVTVSPSWLSGGVDSSVAGVLLQKAIGDQLTCIFVDHGLLRKGEGDQVMEMLGGKFGLNIIRVDASKRFLDLLAGVDDPEKKRKIIGNEFVYVFDDEASKLKGVDFLAQGTLYTDIIESGTETAQTIKSHHNVGGLPAVVDFKGLIEPLRNLFKDEVRELGSELGLADYLVWRQPFPGPGLAIRVMGEITKDKLDILRDADYIFRDEIAKAGLDRSINQYFAVLTSTRTVGVMGDFRTYDYTLALRGVTTTDFMTADWARIPYDVLDTISRRIVNEVQHINRIVYDITSKPPATIEWE